jgi:hypothetical protein
MTSAVGRIIMATGQELQVQQKREVEKKQERTIPAMHGRWRRARSSRKCR